MDSNTNGKHRASGMPTTGFVTAVADGARMIPKLRVDVPTVFLKSRQAYGNERAFRTAENWFVFVVDAMNVERVLLELASGAEPHRTVRAQEVLYALVLAQDMVLQSLLRSERLFALVAPERFPLVDVDRAICQMLAHRIRIQAFPALVARYLLLLGVAPRVRHQVSVLDRDERAAGVRAVVRHDELREIPLVLGQKMTQDSGERVAVDSAGAFELFSRGTFRTRQAPPPRPIHIRMHVLDVLE